MSYILDALRKSDQQRRRNAAPTLLTLQPSAVVRKRPAKLVYGLLAVILVGGGVVIGWLRPWQSEPAAVKALDLKTAEPKPIESKPIESKPAPPTPAESAIVSPVVKPGSGSPETHALASGRTAPPAERRVDIAAADAAGETVIEMDKLPNSIRDEVSKITISVHAYSITPEKRLVSVGRRILHEGDDVTPGLKLEEITPDGMILSYKGYRFRRGVK